MIKQKKILLQALAYSLTLVSSPATAKHNPWYDLAKRDLDFAYKTLKDNHPGPADPVNRDFNKWLEEGFKKAKQKLQEVESYDSMLFLLKWYGSGFHDGHLFIGPKLNSEKVVWPQFVISQRADKYVVIRSENMQAKVPETGWEIKGCDNIGVKQILEEQVFPFNYGTPSIESDWAKLAPYSLIDYGNPWVKRARNCDFIDRNGKKHSIELDWIKAGRSEVETIADKAAFGKTPSQEITEEGGLVWISLPSFNPERTDVSGLKQIATSVSNYRSKTWIVFDVRGNTGGNSQWGEDILVNLYGAKYVEYIWSKNDVKPSTVHWRISKGNSEYLDGVAPWLKDRFGPESDIYLVFSSVAKKMSEAIKLGRKGLLLQPDLEKNVKEKPVEKPSSPVTAKVVLLTDGRCASACLDFADKILEIPEVIHVGLPTSADTVYMDMRSVDLPSGIMRLGFAIKVYRDRKRGHNEYYKPKVRYDGDIGDTANLKHWVQRL